MALLAPPVQAASSAHDGVAGLALAGVASASASSLATTDARSSSPGDRSASSTATATFVRPPKSHKRPKSNPRSSPAPSVSPALAPVALPPPPVTQEDVAPPPPPVRPQAVERTQSSASTASGQSSASEAQSAQRTMLPSHPAVLPSMYDSTASVTDDADGEYDEHDARAAGAHVRMAGGRRKGKLPVGASALSHVSEASHGRSAMSKMARMASEQSASTRRPSLSPRLGSDRQMPSIDGREGLGFRIGEYDQSDYAAAMHAARRPQHRSYGSSRSVPSSPHAGTYSSRPRARDFAVTSDAGIALDSDSTVSTSRRVRFEQPYRPPGRERSGSHIALQPEHIVFPDALPPVPPVPAAFSPASTASRRLSETSSAAFSPRSHTLSSPATSIGSPVAYKTPTSPRARSPRRASGTSTSAADAFPQRPVSALFFPSAPAKTASKRQQPAGPISQAADAFPLPSVFPARQRQRPPASLHLAHEQPFPSAASSPSPASATFPTRARPVDAAAPFPTRKLAKSLPSSPSPASHSWFIADPAEPFPPPPSSSRRYSLHSSASPQPAAGNGVTVSPPFAPAISATEPVFPSPGARLSSDGFVRASTGRRRVSSAHWEVPPALAQLQEERDSGDELDKMMRAQQRLSKHELSQQEREERRRSVHADLIRQLTVTAGSGPHSPLEMAFDRAVREAETVRKSLGSVLLSDETDARRTSATPTITPRSAREREVDGEDGGSSPDRASTSASTSQDHGLTPSISSTGSDLSSLPSFPDVPHHVAAHPAYAEEDADAHAEVIAVDYAAVAAAKSVTAADPRRLSAVSEASQYDDAPSSPPRSAGLLRLHEVPEPPVAVRHVEVGSPDAPSGGSVQRHTEELVTSTRRSLDDIGEEPENEDELHRRMRQLSSSSGLRTPSTPLTPLFTSPARSTRARETSAGSSISAPLSPDLYRTTSPAPSQRSAGSSSAVSHTAAPKRAGTGAAAGQHFKPKLTLGKKIGQFFSSATAAPMRAGISSRDALALGTATGDDSVHWDARSASGRSATTHVPSVAGSAPTPVPPSPVVNLAPALDEKENVHPGKATRSPTVNGLDDLLSRFEQEDKERFRGIAAARKTAPVIVEQQQPASQVPSPLAAPVVAV
ncbi:uncharacterized protein JCM10292_006602 [Rhodotorula paludigena]|uniref:uncharacterized protein n=1 Tax=Rhodotorula paludigena TaxID=86838 RepID=UPI0031715A0A